MARETEFPRASRHPVGDKLVALVVDDSDIDREVIVEILRAAGIEALGLPSPIGATRAARDSGARVAIVDQNLPAMDGSKLISLFRSNRSLAHICVIIVSSGDEAVMAEVARAAQADAFVSKARVQEELVDTVRRLIR